MKFIKLTHTGELLNLSFVYGIKICDHNNTKIFYGFDVDYVDYTCEVFNTNQEALERFEEIQKLLGIENELF